MELKSTTIERKVCEEHFASAMKSGSLNVLATPQMIAWMEEAACMCLDLDQGKTSVGTLMNVTHDKASPLNAVVTVTAEMIEVDGRKIKFRVLAMENGEIIGQGYHERFIVDAQKFLSKIY